MSKTRKSKTVNDCCREKLECSDIIRARAIDLANVCLFPKPIVENCCVKNEKP